MKTSTRLFLAVATILPVLLLIHADFPAHRHLSPRNVLECLALGAWLLFLINRLGNAPARPSHASPAARPSEALWTYHYDLRTCGTVSYRKLLDLSFSLPDETLVCQEGATNWQTIAELFRRQSLN